MKIGQTVRLLAYGGAIIERRIVGMGGNVVYVTKEEEYQAALREGREPVSVGFSAEDVVEDGEQAVEGGEG